MSAPGSAEEPGATASSAACQRSDPTGMPLNRAFSSLAWASSNWSAACPGMPTLSKETATTSSLVKRSAPRGDRHLDQELVESVGIDTGVGGQDLRCGC